MKDTNVLEVWRKLKYPNIEKEANRFEISSFGRLRNTTTKHIYKPEILRTGYYSVRTTLGSRDNKIHIIIHKAVAYTFIENPFNFPEINHKDGDKLNNKVDNLEWCSSHYNQLHKYETKLFDKQKISGESNHSHKLTYKQVEFIRENYKYRDKQYNTYKLAEMFGVSRNTIYKILHNITWNMECEV